MKIRLENNLIQRLQTALKRAGTREIGGQLFGEQLAVSDFRVTELTVQARPGSFARFVVDVLQAARDALRFHMKTQHQYHRFNYIGEWHSHPSFAVHPSDTDIATMRDIVRNPTFRGSFAVLMIVRLDSETLATGAWVFDPRGAEHVITVAMRA